MKTSFFWVALAAAALQAGCGGGGPVVDDRVVPASATASPAAYASFVDMLAPDDEAEPLLLDGLMPPTTEVEDPKPLR